MNNLLDGLPYRFEGALPSGPYNQVVAAVGPSGPVVVKIARARPEPVSPSATNAIFVSQAIALATGSVGRWTPDPAELLRAEAAILADLHHPGFVTLIDQGEHRGRPYLVLERIAGTTWRQAMEAGRGPTLDQFRSLVSILRECGLAFHGDLKPENLMLDQRGAVRVLDPSAGAWQVNGLGQFERALLTPHYNPLLLGSDISALGLMLVEATTGRHPLVLSDPSRPEHVFGPELERFYGGYAALGRAGMLHLYRHMPLPRDLGELSPELEALALACLGVKRHGDGLEMTEMPGLAAVAQALS